MLEILAALAPLPVILIIYLIYIGFFRRVEIRNKRLPSTLLLYCEYVGDYSKIGTVFQNVRNNVKPLFQPSTLDCGIYYDSPAFVQNTKQSRAVVGLLLQEHERADAQRFIADHPIFKLRQLPEAECIYNEFPYKSFMSILVVLMRVYPKIKDFAMKNRIFEDPLDISGIMEVYTGPTMEVIIPYGPEAQGYFLTTQPEPEYKSFVYKKQN